MTRLLAFEGTLPDAKDVLGAARAAEIREGLDAITETLTELWLEQHPQLAWKVGNA